MLRTALLLAALALLPAWDGGGCTTSNVWCAQRRSERPPPPAQLSFPESDSEYAARIQAYGSVSSSYGVFLFNDVRTREIG